MPFAVFKQTKVLVHWDVIETYPDTVTKFSRLWDGQDKTKTMVLDIIKDKTGLSTEDLAAKKDKYYLNDKKQVSCSYTDRDNACLVLDLECTKNIYEYWEGIALSTIPIYTVEKIP